jgi:hypothetical protein
MRVLRGTLTELSDDDARERHRADKLSIVATGWEGLRIDVLLDDRESGAYRRVGVPRWMTVSLSL